MRFLSLTLLLGALCHAEIVDSIRNNDLAALKSDLKSAVSYKDKRGTTALMYAAFTGSLESMQLLIDAGADVNAKNAFDATALMWCATDFAKVKLLVSKGADVNAKSKQRRTPLFLAANSAGTSEIVKYLLDHGASLKDADSSPVSTPLTAAADAGDLATFKLLLDRGASTQEPAGGFTLMRAAQSGHLEIMRLLLDRGVPADAVSPPQVAEPVKNGDIQLGHFTPLTLAVTFGGPDAVKLLLDHKANPNHADIRGMTPLMLAIGTDHADPRTVKLLLAAGADRKIKSKAGETADDWAKKFQNPAIMTALGLPLTKAPAPVFAAKPLPLKEALMKSASLLEKNTGSFFTEGGCSACHSHNLSSMAIAAVKPVGFHPETTGHGDHFRQTQTFWASQEQLLLQRLDAPGGNNMTAFGAIEFAAEGMKPSFTTDAMVHNIAAQQLADGSWHDDGFARPPMSDGNFSHTALVVRVIATYGAPGRKAEFSARIQRAAAWLSAAKPVTTEDRNMQLLGLLWAGTDTAKLKPLARQVIAQQRPDGGWSQTPYLQSDAYATGQSLVAMKEAGIPATDPSYRKGIEFLLKTQQPDGSWHVISRAPQFQPYFQSGFPYDHDQWISMAGTSWATMALGYGAETAARAAR